MERYQAVFAEEFDGRDAAGPQEVRAEGSAR
jgi:hypothetical protein